MTQCCLAPTCIPLAGTGPHDHVWLQRRLGNIVFILECHVPAKFGGSITIEGENRYCETSRLCLSWFSDPYIGLTMILKIVLCIHFSV